MLRARADELHLVVLRKRVSFEERLWSKVDRGGRDDCWEWLAGKSLGYGMFFVDGRMEQAHRIVYEILVGPIPDDHHLDHTCENPGCVNPSHLEPLTPADHVRRTCDRRARDRTKCVHGHEYTDTNTYVDRGGRRRCRICDRDRKRLTRARVRV